MNQTFRVGTSGYSYPGNSPQGWYGVFYPINNRKGFSELECYFAFFDTVEINSTFYRPPTAEMARAWVNKTSPDFEFAIKAWQLSTGPGRRLSATFGIRWAGTSAVALLSAKRR